MANKYIFFLTFFYLHLSIFLPCPQITVLCSILLAQHTENWWSMVLHIIYTELQKGGVKRNWKVTNSPHWHSSSVSRDVSRELSKSTILSYDKKKNPHFPRPNRVINSNGIICHSDTAIMITWYEWSTIKLCFNLISQRKQRCLALEK